MLRRARGETRFAGALLAAALIFGMTADEIILPQPWSSPAFAQGNANGNAGGNGNGNDNGNTGGNGGGSGNAGGNTGANGNAGGHGKSQGEGSAASAAASEAAAPNSALGLLESGRIQPLAEVYRVAEQQFGGEVVDAKLVADGKQGWAYDLRVVTQDGYVRNVSYNASTLTLTSMNGAPAK
jgi:hypothetical protein